jgi:hypothetical protein
LRGKTLREKQKKDSEEHSNTCFLSSDVTPQKTLTLLKVLVKKSKEYFGEKTRNKKKKE